MKRLLVCPIALASLLPATASAVEKESKPVIAVYDLEGNLSEAGQGESSLLDLSMDPTRPLTMFDLSRSLGKAAADPAVKAVVVDADEAELDFSQIQAIRRHFQKLREAGKDVWLYSEHLTNATALLGSSANHFALMPEADCGFSGIRAESMYYKGLMDKVGVRAEVIHIGDFKSYGETYYRTGPSDEARQQEEKLVDSVFTQIVDAVASGRKLAPDKVKSLIDDGSLTAIKVVKEGLADELLYRTDFVKKLRETYGKDADFDREYQLPDLDGPQIEGMMDVLKLMFKDDKAAKSRKDFIAVVAMDGDISEESVAPVRTEILKLAKEEKAKGLVLRVNSPGGSALASEVLWEATDEWKATGKPFVVSMGGVAASGGYYISSSADRIFAEAGTITGSIGVVGMKFVIGDALDRLGVTSHSTQRGKNAGAESMMHGYTDDEAKLVRESMIEVYGTFKKRVTDGRGKALKGDLEPLAGGRVYSGKQALEIGLVDELGGLPDAIAYVAGKAKLEAADTKLLPEPKSGIEGIFAKPQKDDDDEIIRMATSKHPANSLRSAILKGAFIDALPEPAKSAISRMASRIEAYQKSQVLLIGPDINLR